MFVRCILQAMKKYILALLLIGCISANAHSCEYCGEWRYSGFEYANRITTDCQDSARDFEDTNITIGENFFYHTYSVDSTPKQINNVDIVSVPMDEYENIPSILVLKDSKVVQKLYMVAPDTVYIHLDGCRFYFKRED